MENYLCRLWNVCLRPFTELLTNCSFPSKIDFVHASEKNCTICLKHEKCVKHLKIFIDESKLIINRNEDVQCISCDPVK